MKNTYCRSLGAGTYGCCYFVVDPNTLEALVIKEFNKDDLGNLVNEAINLK